MLNSGTIRSPLQISYIEILSAAGLYYPRFMTCYFITRKHMHRFYHPSRH